MEAKTFEEIRRRLIEVDKVIRRLDPAIRANAFELFNDYLKGGTHTHLSGEGKHKPERPSGDDIDLRTLVEKHGDAKPSDNAFLLTADWYHKYGSAPFTVANIKQAATSAGLTVPDRLDMTLTAAQNEGKKLFQSVGRGSFKPTVTGELYLKKTYTVTKGNGTPPAAAKP